MLDADDDSFNRQTTRLPEVEIACEQALRTTFLLSVKPLLVLLFAIASLAAAPPRFNATLESLGDQMQVTLDGKPSGLLKSADTAHEAKESPHFTVKGPGVLFDDVRIWAAR